MVPRNVFIAIICTTLLMWSGVSVADEYQPDQFLGLDLSQAVLSPKPLGPPAHFAPVAVEARTDLGSDAKPVRVVRVTKPKTAVAHLRVEKPRGTVRTRLAGRRGDPRCRTFEYQQRADGQHHGVQSEGYVAQRTS